MFLVIMRFYVKSYIHVGIVAPLGECLTGNVPSLVCAAEGDPCLLVGEAVWLADQDKS